MTSATYQVTGMTCEHCVRAVSAELVGLDGVTSVTVDLVPGGTSAVTVTSQEPRSMSLADDWWVLLHGTPLTPAVWDGVAAHFAANAAVLRRGDPVDPEAALGRRAAPPSGSSGARCLMTRQRQHHALAH